MKLNITKAKVKNEQGEYIDLPILGAQGKQGNSYNIEVTKVNDYLYEYNCPALDYENAYNYFLSKKPEIVIGGCSSVRNGNFYGRNLDWLYDNTVEFVVKTSANNEMHGTIGVAGQLSKLTKEFVEKRVWDEVYRILPFMITDGINDAGVVCNTNVVPLDKGYTTGTTPTDEKRYDVCSLMLPRFILDRFSSASDAVEYIQRYVSVYTSSALYDMHYDVHIMVADKDKTFAIEFIENEIKVVDISSTPYMTNFHLFGVTRNADGSVYTPETQDSTHNAVTTNGITVFGSGLERYNLINENYSSASTKDGMQELMAKLNYTNTYKADTIPFWYTEFVGGGNTTMSQPSAFSGVVSEYFGYFENRQRGDGKTWQTNHSAVYDIAQKAMSLRVQESGASLEYKFNYYTKEEIDKKFDDIPDAPISAPSEPYDDTPIKELLYGTDATQNLFIDIPQTKLVINKSPQTFSGSSTYIGGIIPIDPSKGDVITIVKPNGKILRAATSTDMPAHNVSYNTSRFMDGNSTTTIPVTSADRYLYLLYYYANNSDVPVEECADGIVVFYGTELVGNGDGDPGIIKKLQSVTDDVAALTLVKKSENLLDNKDVYQFNLTSADSKFFNSSTLVGCIVPVNPSINPYITITANGATRFRFATSATMPAHGVATLDKVVSDGISSKTIIMSKDARFLYFCYGAAADENINDVRSSVKIFYGESWNQNNDKPIADYLQNIYSLSGGNLDRIFANAADRPIITIIDDDTYTIPSVTWWHDMLSAKGVKGTYACITREIETSANHGLPELLQQYEEEGFHITVHCDYQQSYFQNTDNGTTSEIETCYSNIVKCLRKMNTYGFTDYKYWVTPYGVKGDMMQELAKKYGFECLVSIGQNQFNDISGNEGRYAIRRIGFNPEDASVSTMARYKSVIDDAKKVNGWVLVGTHSAEWLNNDGSSKGLESRFNEMLDYAIDAGFEFMTLNQAFKHRKAIYDLHDMF